nr:PREDICTED: uncharacterized protein LOC100874676 isoform X2 [Megachile rotundata]
MNTQKCCSHCPGKLVSQRTNEFHECCQPNYVTGSLKVSSLKKRVPEPFNKKKMKRSTPSPATQCYDQFALAKRLHAENLQHQPLPDKVHDSVFKNPGLCRRLSSGRYCECCEGSKNDCKKLSKRYGPVLGCKEPKTKMDLAICWETPVDPVYEPSRPTHIDGSEGGLAPAIFSLVEHASKSTAEILRPRSTKNEDGSSCRREERDLNPPRNEHVDQMRKCCCECLCKGLDGLHISKKSEGEPHSRRSFRKCSACESKNKDDPRLIRSAVGLALGLEKNGDGQKRNDDTLAPPFSVVNGCRDADYPEHWRLMSVYQQSYKNPYRRRSYRC